MRTKDCENCGCKTYNYLCVNCHEANYIQDQYEDLGMEVPMVISQKAIENFSSIIKALANQNPQ